jgi:hypothetical protein
VGRIPFAQCESAEARKPARAVVRCVSCASRDLHSVPWICHPNISQITFANRAAARFPLRTRSPGSKGRPRSAILALLVGALLAAPQLARASRFSKTVVALAFGFVNCATAQIILRSRSAGSKGSAGCPDRKPN